MPRPWLTVVGALFLLASGAALLVSLADTGPVEDTRPAGGTGDQAAATLPAFHIGDTATYTDLELGRDLTVTIEGPGEVWRGAAEPSEALLVRFANRSGQFPQYEQALDPATGSLLRIMDHCVFNTDQHRRICDTTWSEGVFETTGEPGLWGLGLLQHRPIAPGDRWQVPLGGSSANGTVNVSVEAPAAERPGVLRVRFQADAPGRGNPFNTMPAQSTAWLGIDHPFPLLLEVEQEGLRGPFPWRYRLEEVRFGNGSTVTFNGSEIPTQPRFGHLVPFDDRIPLDEGVPGEYFPHQEALRVARENEAFIRWRSDHPDAFLVEGKARYLDRGPAPGGMGERRDQDYEFVWYAGSGGEAWEVHVTRESEERLGVEVHNETRVEASRAEDRPLLEDRPFPQVASVHPVDAFAERFPRLPDLGPVTRLRWGPVPSAPAPGSPLRLIGTVSYDPGPACTGVDPCLSMQRVPYLSFDLVSGELHRFMGPPGTMDALDRGE